MNETSLLLNIHNIKIIAKICSKEVKIKTHGQQRIHVTAILWIEADGTNYHNVSV